MNRSWIALLISAPLVLVSAEPEKKTPPAAATRLLVSSVQQKDIKGVQIALRQGADPNIGASVEATPVVLALFNCSSSDSPDDRRKGFEILKILVSAGARLSSTSAELSCAIGSNDKQIFTFLLENGLNPHELIHGYSTVEYAYLYEKDDVLPLLRVRGVREIASEKKPLMKVLRAITNYDVKGLKLGIKALPDINQPDPGGRTVLTTVLSFPFWSQTKQRMVEIVLAENPDFNIPSRHPDDHGRYPVHFLVDAYTRTPDEAQVVASWTEMALLLGKANPGVINLLKQTPLHIAAKHGNLKVIKSLLQAGVDPLARDIQGDRASAKAKDSAVRQLLVEAETTSK